jgi:predicted hydrocarbon binding protein
MSAVFGKPVEAVEVKCMAKGDEHCEFKIQKQI